MSEYRNPYQWNDQWVEWDPQGQQGSRASPWDVTFEQVNPGYISGLLSLRERVQSGQASAEERQQYEAQASAARAIPMRDPSTLQFGWNNDEVGSWDEGGSDWWKMINGSSPDLGPVMLSISDRIAQGTATPQERELLKQTMAYDQDWNYRASVPQASDAFSPLGDNLMGALGVLALGATGGLAGGALAAGGGLASTLGSLGTLSGIAGTGAGVLGQATDEEWLQRLGMALGAAGGIAGGVGGLANLWSSGVQSLGDAARLAQGAGRVVGGVGAMADSDVLRQAGGWLGTAGQLGGGVDAFSNVLGGDSSALGPGLRQLGGGVQGLLRAAQQAQQRGSQAPGPPGQPVPRTMSPMDWLRMRAQPRPMPRTVLGNL